MKYRLSDTDGLCRSDGRVYESYMNGDVWGFDGYAYGAFHGFESSKLISREEALAYLINECDVAADKAEAELDKKGLNKEETIAHLKKVLSDYSMDEILALIGCSVKD